ncbi:MAG: 2-phosphoglycerate kinase [Candidatus Azotimanducaceae bacterium]|jgi:2-phosphoglycerate kinase
MTTLVKEIYDAFMAAGIEQSKAESLAAAIEENYLRKDGHNLATKSDLQEVKVTLIYWIVGALTLSILVDKLFS